MQCHQALRKGLRSSSGSLAISGGVLALLASVHEKSRWRIGWQDFVGEAEQQVIVMQNAECYREA